MAAKRTQRVATGGAAVDTRAVSYTGADGNFPHSATVGQWQGATSQVNARPAPTRPLTRGHCRPLVRSCCVEADALVLYGAYIHTTAP